MDGASVYELLETEFVIFSVVVLIVWNMLLLYLIDNDLKFLYLKEVLIGGLVVFCYLLEVFDRDYGVIIVYVWGMMEFSLLGIICCFKVSM